MAAALSLSLLGSFAAILDGQPVTAFGTDKARALLAYLAVEADRAHRRDALAGLFWPESPQDRARHSLRQALSSLRRSLGDADRAEPFLLVERESVQFNRGAGARLDVAELLALAAASRSHAHRHVDNCLPCMGRREAVAGLYRGPFLAEFFLADSIAFEEWASLWRERIRRQVQEALAGLVLYYELRGDLARAIEAARRQVEIEPWLEEAHRQLICLLALDGRRSAALAQYEACRQALAQELGVEPTAETRALYEQIRQGEEAGGEWRVAGGAAPRYSLPPAPTPFVGREEERRELADLLADPGCRLVTLTGPGGIGKTRLALQVAVEQVGLYRHGVVFVPLAGLDSADVVPGTIAEAVQFRFHSQGDPVQQLLDFFREKQMLLVLDNMEHLLEGSEFLSRLLRQAPGLLLLVTSRERLNLREEQVYEIEGLPWPAATIEEGLEEYAAVSLFVQTARRAQRRFALSEREAPCVARICRIVEGLPLAVELAAAWIPVRTCSEMATEIEHNLDILATTLRNVPARHRSLHAAFEHSWGLLSAQERGALGRLSLFPGGFEEEAARQIADTPPATLAALVVKSLLRRDASGRYEMHRLLQQYAQEKLDAEPAARRRVEARYRDYYSRFLEEREAWLQGTRQAEALEAIGARIENVRLAWRLASEGGDVEALARSLTSLGMFLAIRCWNQEGVALFGQAVAHIQRDATPGDEAGPRDRRQDIVLGRLLAWQGHFASQLGRYREAQELLEKSLEILSAHGAEQERAFSLYTLAQILCHGQNDYPAAEQLFQESLPLYEAEGDRYGRAQALDGLGDVSVRQGRHDEARAYYEGGLALRREIGDRWGLAVSLGSLGGLAGRRGAYDEARRWFEESLAISRDLDNPRGIAACLHNLSTIAYLQEDYVESRRLRLETLDICRQIGYRWGIASSLKSLGDVACRLEDPAGALRYLGESLTLLREDGDRRGQAYALNSLGTVAHDIGEGQAARQYFRQALEAAVEIQEPALAVDVVMSLAHLVAEEGDAERALALLAFVVDHPACEQQTRDRAEPLRAKLAGCVAAEVAHDAEALGRGLGLEEVVARALG